MGLQRYCGPVFGRAQRSRDGTRVPVPLKHHFQSGLQVIEMADYFSYCYMMFLL
jgi:hypothetical protein